MYLVKIHFKEKQGNQYLEEKDCLLSPGHRMTGHLLKVAYCGYLEHLHTDSNAAGKELVWSQPELTYRSDFLHLYVYHVPNFFQA